MIGRTLSRRTAALRSRLISIRLFAVSVHGDSMRPSIADGDVLLATRSPRRGPLRVGDVVVFPRPEGLVACPDDPPYLVKRVLAGPRDVIPGGRVRLWDGSVLEGFVPSDQLLLEGTNVKGYMEAKYLAPPAAVVGRVLLRLVRRELRRPRSYSDV